MCIQLVCGVKQYSTVSASNGVDFRMFGVLSDKRLSSFGLIKLWIKWIYQSPQPFFPFQFPHSVLLPSRTQDEPKEIRGENELCVTLKYREITFFFCFKIRWRSSPSTRVAGRSRGERLHLLPEEGGHQPPGGGGGEDQEEEEEGRRRQDGAIKAHDRNSTSQSQHEEDDCGKHAKNELNYIPLSLVNYRMLWGQVEKDAALPF